MGFDFLRKSKRLNEFEILLIEAMIIDVIMLIHQTTAVQTKTPPFSQSLRSNQLSPILPPKALESPEMLTTNT